MRQISSERERIRARERAKLEAQKKQASLRVEPKKFFKDIVDRFNLTKQTEDGNMVKKLRMAGYRGQNPVFVFLSLRLIMPLVMFAIAALYVFFILQLEQPFFLKLGDRAWCVAYARLLRADALGEEPDHQAAEVDPPRLAGCARPAADLRRIRHGHRGRLPQGVGGDRRPVDPAGRGAEPDHGRALLPAGSPQGLREPRRAHRPRRRALGGDEPDPGGEIRHADRHSRCACWRRKTATCACRRPRRRPPRCRRS